MTTSEYQNLTARETTPGASSRLFSFARIRSGTTTRFYPGDGAKLHFANRDVDTLEIPGVPSGYLAAGDVVTATYKGVTVFRGDVATIVESKNRGTDATQTVTCVGPWSKMQRLVYRQNWYTGSGYSYSSRLILNQTKTGAAQNLNGELTEILDHAPTVCGYTRGTVSVSTQTLPLDECRDITVADAIKRELRFFPKAITRFDYSTDTPTLNIVKSSSATSASYVADIPKNLREYVYNAHPITGVDLEIEATGTIEGVDYRQITHQRAGVTTSDNTTVGNPDCLYATLQIKGASSNATRQSFKSVTEDVPSNLNDVSWWKERHPRLANVASNAITISDGARSPSNYQRISAATAGELEAAGLHCEVSKFTCKATITTTDDKEEDVYLTLNFLTTNATGTAANPKTYTWITDSSSESGESVPSGLAATILAERAGTLLSERLSIRLGDALPQLGDAIVETEGTVFLQSFDVDCGSLTADLNFGIPEYLAPEDMAALLSNFRNKCTSSSGTIRSTGKTSDGSNNVEMGAIPPLSSSEFAPGTKAKTTIKSSGSTGGSITLDSSALESTESISVREVTVTENGEEKTVKVLATDDFSIPETSEDDDNDCVESANGATGAVTWVGGTGITVSTSGTTITISTSDDEEGSEGTESDPCEHTGAGGVEQDEGGSGAGGGGGGGVGADLGGSSGGCTDCGNGEGTVGGQSAEGTTSGSDTATGSAGKAVTTPPTGSTSSAESGKAATTTDIIQGQSGTSTSSNGKAATGSSTTATSTSAIYGGTHKDLTNTKSMNESPFKSSGNYTAIGSRATTPIYTNTHTQLTNTKTMNESPFKNNPNFKAIGTL